MLFTDLPLIRDIDWYFRFKRLRAIHRERESLRSFRSSPVYQYGRLLRAQYTCALRPVVRTHYSSKV